jgi:hypothetical protein
MNKKVWARAIYLIKFGKGRLIDLCSKKCRSNCIPEQGWYQNCLGERGDLPLNDCGAVHGLRYEGVNFMLEVLEEGRLKVLLQFPCGILADQADG